MSVETLHCLKLLSMK